MRALPKFLISHFIFLPNVHGITWFILFTPASSPSNKATTVCPSFGVNFCANAFTLDAPPQGINSNDKLVYLPFFLKYLSAADINVSSVGPSTINISSWDARKRFCFWEVQMPLVNLSTRLTMSLSITFALPFSSLSSITIAPLVFSSKEAVKVGECDVIILLRWLIWSNISLSSLFLDICIWLSGSSINTNVCSSDIASKMNSITIIFFSPSLKNADSIPPLNEIFKVSITWLAPIYLLNSRRASSSLGLNLEISLDDMLGLSPNKARSWRMNNVIWFSLRHLLSFAVLKIKSMESKLPEAIPNFSWRNSSNAILTSRVASIHNNMYFHIVLSMYIIDKTLGASAVRTLSKYSSFAFL